LARFRIAGCSDAFKPGAAWSLESLGLAGAWDRRSRCRTLLACSAAPSSVERGQCGAADQCLSPPPAGSPALGALRRGGLHGCSSHSQPRVRPPGSFWAHVVCRRPSRLTAVCILSRLAWRWPVQPLQRVGPTLCLSRGNQLAARSHLPFQKRQRRGAALPTVLLPVHRPEAPGASQSSRLASALVGSGSPLPGRASSGRGALEP